VQPVAFWPAFTTLAARKDSHVPELETSLLPGTVVAAHLAACATGLADSTTPRRVPACVGTAGELAEILGHLVAGQHHVSVTLARLAEYVRDRRLAGTLDGAPVEDLTALTEVLRAAAQAAGYSSEALAQSRPVVAAVVEATGEGTRL
jgi:hypothetical protein